MVATHGYSRLLAGATTLRKLMYAARAATGGWSLRRRCVSRPT